MADTSSLQAKLANFAQLVGGAAAQQLFDETQDAAPELSGDTKRAMTVQQVGASVRYEWLIRSVTPQGDWYEEGTPEHIIRPVTAKRLRFIGSDGSVVYALVVQHPGQPARPWFHATLTQEAWMAALEANEGIAA